MLVENDKQEKPMAAVRIVGEKTSFIYLLT